MTVLEHTDVEQVLTQVWSSFVGEEEPLRPRLAAAGAPFAGSPTLSATVTIADGWNGSVTVELSQDVAVALTRTMLCLPDAESVEDGDLADAVGELVNMVGGNIKSLLPGPSRLSLPAVAAGRAVPPTDAVEVARLDGQWAGEPVRVTVHSHTEVPT